MQSEASEELEVKLRHSHAECGACASCSCRPWADVGNRALRNYLGSFTLCLTAGARELLVTGALGRGERPLKCSKSSQFNSLGRASLFFYYFCSAGLATHLHTRGIIFFLRSAESQTTSSSLTCANTHLLVFPSSLCLTHVPALPGALTHARCRPLLSAHGMSSFLSTQVGRWPFVQLWGCLSRFINSTFCHVPQTSWPHFLELISL